jgi:hypothetical protein
MSGEPRPSVSLALGVELMFAVFDDALEVVGYSGLGVATG